MTGIWLIVVPRISQRLKRRRTFFSAVQKGLLLALNRVIYEGQDVDEIDVTDPLGLERRAVHYAVQYKKIEVIEILMRMMADVSVTDTNGKTAFHYACQNTDQYLNQCASNQMLLARSRNTWLAEAVLPVIPAESVAMIKALIKSHFALEQKSRFNLKRAVAVGDSNGQTCLHLACISSLAPVVELLCDGGSDVNAPDTLMRTPLHLASWVGSAECIQVLLKFNAKLNVVNKVGRTPLHVAACFGRTEACKVLLDSGAAIDVVNNNLNTPLHLALYEEKMDCALFLIKNGAETFVPNRFGESAMMIGCELHPKLAKAMLDMRRTERHDETLTTKQVFATYDMTGLDRVPRSKFDDDDFSGFESDKMKSKTRRVWPSQDSPDADSKNKRRTGDASYIDVRGLGRFHEVSSGCVVAEEDERAVRVKWEANSPRSPRNQLCQKSRLLPLQLIVADEERDLISHPVVLKALNQKWDAYAKSVVLKDSLIHFLLVVFWMCGTVGWGESVETSCESFSMSASNVTGRGGYVHATFLWAYYGIVGWSLVREIVRGALRSLSQEGFWVLFDLVYFVASLGLGVPMHVLAQTSRQTRSSCKLAQGFYSLISLLVWFRCVQFIGVRQLCGPYVKIMGKMWRDMLIFVIVFSFILLAFAHALYLTLASSGANGESIETYSTFTESVLQTFLMFSTAFNFGSIYHSEQRTWASVLYVMYILIAPVLMVNLLICMLFQTYDSVKDDSIKEWLLEWAKKIIVAAKRDQRADSKLPEIVVEVEEPRRHNTLTVGEQTLNTVNSVFSVIEEMKQELVGHVAMKHGELTHKLNGVTQSIENMDRRLHTVEAFVSKSARGLLAKVGSSKITLSSHSNRSARNSLSSPREELLFATFDDTKLSRTSSFKLSRLPMPRGNIQTDTAQNLVSPVLRSPKGDLEMWSGFPDKQAGHPSKLSRRSRPSSLTIQEAESNLPNQVERASPKNVPPLKLSPESLLRVSPRTGVRFKPMTQNHRYQESLVSVPPRSGQSSELVSTPNALSNSSNSSSRLVSSVEEEPQAGAHSDIMPLMSKKNFQRSMTLGELPTLADTESRVQESIDGDDAITIVELTMVNASTNLPSGNISKKAKKYSATETLPDKPPAESDLIAEDLRKALTPGEDPPDFLNYSWKMSEYSRLSKNLDLK